MEYQQSKSEVQHTQQQSMSKSEFRKKYQCDKNGLKTRKFTIARANSVRNVGAVETIHVSAYSNRLKYCFDVAIDFNSTSLVKRKCNFRQSHKTIPPHIKDLVRSKDVAID